ncbi:glycoside hydrolase family 25 protein [Streptomyces sp. 769]|uniref:glycoside hydrolase family 25 protein n=1 Tax=Streptomyces sp. 769 TaxID=1262452 RepID=UPI00057DA2AD|nr:glycoside hydrolase family 25 protein [Streptomyces sp. 769]AJC53452.1 hydrolase [Streptomyces sp. 769]
MTVTGIDVSSAQSEKYPTAGSDFVFIKVTEGTTYTNPKWVAQRKTARNAGLVTGFYHFARPGPVTSQVDYFLSKINLIEGDILILDWEDARVPNSWKDSWLKQVQQRTPGHKTLLYCNRDFWLHRDTTSFAGDGLWIAQYNNKPGQPDIHSAWLFHQHTDRPIDTSIGRFEDKAALHTWSGHVAIPA